MTRETHGRGLYLHIPFCRSKCAYCDFPSFAGCEKEIPRVTARMCAELFDCRDSFPDTVIETMYIGGGTPSLLPPPLMDHLLKTAREAFPFAPDAEISCEMNPGTITEAFLETCVQNGVSRVSLGAQSSDGRLLQAIGRIVFERVRAEGCTACAGYVLGLPERPVEHLILKDCFFRFRDGEAMIPAMAEQVEPCQRRGLIVRNAAQLTLDNVKMDGVIGPEVERHDPT